MPSIDRIVDSKDDLVLKSLTLFVLESSPIHSSHPIVIVSTFDRMVHNYTLTDH